MSWIFCIIVFGLQFLVAMLLQIGKRKTKAIPDGGSVTEITVIVPFHNEAKRISKLVASLNETPFNPSFELIFVDDHSTDGTAAILANQLQIPFTCIKNEAKKGKKYAIRFGVQQAKHDYIITWDADISIPNEYFNAIEKLPKVDLNILPVQMCSINLLGKLANVEFTFLETLGFGLGGFGQSVLCYGANLGFKKAAFLEVDGSRTDYDIPSGDDLFLLKALQKNGKNIHVDFDKSITVLTAAPTGLLELLSQRKRWFAKMGNLINGTTLFPLVLLVLVQIASVTAWVLCISNPCFLIPLAVKYVAELLATWQLLKRSMLHGLILLIHQFWYPVFCLLLLFPIKKEDRWKK